MVLVSRNAASLADVRDEIHAINKDIEVLIIATDLLSAEAVASFWEKVKDKFGHADVLINNAANVAGGRVDEQPVESFFKDFVSTAGTFNGYKGNGTNKI